ncbi:MAG: cell division protein ZapA [Burkholderiales bacterium]|jgi:cell division protein ZapA|nr:cell division protein ZapA [Burkholderiales bacterium]
MTASSERTLALDVSILGRSYKVACKERERAALLDAVSMLNERMETIQSSNKSISIERIAVIAALNLVNELLQTRVERDSAKKEAVSVPDDIEQARHRLRELHLSIDRMLAEPEKTV